jgi:hypothetical protein
MGSTHARANDGLFRPRSTRRFSARRKRRPIGIPRHLSRGPRATRNCTSSCRHSTERLGNDRPRSTTHRHPRPGVQETRERRSSCDPLLQVAPRNEDEHDQRSPRPARGGARRLPLDLACTGRARTCALPGCGTRRSVRSGPRAAASRPAEHGRSRGVTRIEHRRPRGFGHELRLGRRG